MLLLELVRGQVAQAAVRADGVVVLPPGLDDDGCFATGSNRREPLRELFKQIQ